MDNEHLRDSVSLGEFLRFHRNKRQISLSKLSQLTRINPAVLENLEKENFDQLPNHTYLIGFLKNICLILDANYNEALILLKTADHRSDQSLSPDEISKKISRWKIKESNNVTKSFLILAVLMGSLIGIDYYQVNMREQSAVSFGIPELRPLNRITAGKSVQQNNNEVQNIAKIITLNAARGDSWIAFKVDQNPVVRFVLKQGNSHKLEGKTIRLTVGNAAAVDVTENSLSVNLSEYIKGSTAYLVFPQELRSKFSPPFFVFEDGSALTKRQHDELKKDI